MMSAIASFSQPFRKHPGVGPIVAEFIFTSGRGVVGLLDGLAPHAVYVPESSLRSDDK